MTSILTSFLAGLVAILGICVVLCGIVALSAVVNGFVLTKLWAWFIVTTFHAAPISIPAAIGISSLVSFMTYQYADTPKNPDSKWYTPAAYCVLRPLMVLAFGAAVHSFL